jgi:hypothetical protein
MHNKISFGGKEPSLKREREGEKKRGTDKQSKIISNDFIAK